MASAQQKELLGAAIVNFARDKQFPEQDEVSAMIVDADDLAPALKTLAAARAELEEEIRSLSRESGPDIDAWIEDAKALEEDINKTKFLANEIVRQAETREDLSKAVQDKEAHVDLLSREVAYTGQVVGALKGLKDVNDLHDKAKEVAGEGRILEALNIISDAIKKLDDIPAHPETRAIRKSDEKLSDLCASIHEDFEALWASMIKINTERRSITISRSDEKGFLDLESAMIVIKAYEEFDLHIKIFYENLDALIVGPRLDASTGNSLSIITDENSIRVSEHDDNSIETLLSELARMIQFLNNELPQEFANSLSKIMMPRLCSKIIDTWLDSAIPTTSEDMGAFDRTITLVKEFVSRLNALNWAGGDRLQEWVQDTPRLWLTKRRETALDWTRNHLSLGIGTPREVLRVFEEKLSPSEEKQIKDMGKADDWDAAWADDDGPAENSSGNEPADATKNSALEKSTEEDDGADAWGWGDEDPIETPQEAAPAGPSEASPPAEEPPPVEHMTLQETYTITSMPEGVLRMVTSILEDAALLAQPSPDYPHTATAIGLFQIPTAVLAMYRAVAPYYYSLIPGGNMYLYNDALWLAEQLKNVEEQWDARTDLSPRAQGKVKFEKEIATIEKFGRKGYGNEMSAQKTLISDFLGGARNLFQQEGPGSLGYDTLVDTITHTIRNVASEWKQILSKSAWPQAVGSLLGIVSKKIVADVGDLDSLGADEAYRIAQMIDKISELDDMFLFGPEDESSPQIPHTSQYAEDWLKMKFLGEILQSDLKELQWLWFESDLSLYFRAEEVIDLIELSFESNHRSRELIAKIRANPDPTSEGFE